MINGVSYLFLSAHWAIYIYLLHLIYTKALKPYLMHYQLSQRALTIQLEQKVSRTKSLINAFKARVTYLTTIFKKIAQQQEHARDLNKKIEHERIQAQARVQAEYAELQKKIMHTRQVHEMYKELAPEIIEQLRSQLVQYAHDNGTDYLQNALNELKKKSASGDRA